MALVEKNVQLGKPKQLSSWRKISLGSWRPTGDSSIHAMIEFDAEPSLDLMQQHGGLRFVHIFCKALGVAIARHPQINSLVRWGRVYPRKNVDIFLHVANNFEDGEDLSGVTLRSVDQKSLVEVKQDMGAAVTRVRNGQDKGFARIKKMFQRLPGLLSRLLLNFSAFILYTLNLWSPVLGSPRDCFGSVMLTNIGSFGADSAFAPIAPYTRIPMVVSLGVVKKRPFVLGDELVARHTVRVGFVFDHRICDGVQAQKMFREVQYLMTDGIQELTRD
jgi:pyruvate dehydrogenase E2 component (dihydrolipoamide acetyltransferase)